MEKKQRMFYFGTQGSPGHELLPIDSDLSDIPNWDWARFDGAMPYWLAEHGTYSQGRLFGTEWSIYAVPWSVDDERNLCHTDFFWEGEHTEEEMKAYIKQDVFLRRQFRFRLEANMVKNGSIVHAADDKILKIHHLGAKGEVFFEAYADKISGRLQQEPYTHHYGFITSCYPATAKQKSWLRKWIREHKSKEE